MHMALVSGSANDSTINHKHPLEQLAGDRIRVFNSGMEKKSAITDIGEISGISGFFIFIFIFYVYFLNLFFSETNIQKINFGR